MTPTRIQRTPFLRPMAFLLAVLACSSGCTPTTQNRADWHPSEEAIDLARQAEEALNRQAEELLNRPDNLPPPEPRRLFDATHTREIIVTMGSLSQPHEVLGPVNVNALGMVDLRSFKLLEEKALELYGSRVDAIINVTHRTEPDGAVFAKGLAVHFVSPPSPSTPTPAQSVE